VEVMQAYRFLGLSTECSDEEITKVYRSLAKRFHPDSNPGADSHNIMMRINEAYGAIREHIKGGRKPGFTTDPFSSRSGPHVRSERVRPASTGRPANGGPHASNTRHTTFGQQETRERTGREAGEDDLRGLWEHIVREYGHEKEDRKTFTLLLRHTYRIIKGYYEEGMHNPGSRRNPAKLIELETLKGKLGVVAERCGRFGREAGSDLYRHRGPLLHRFLLSLHRDMDEECDLFTERRASAVQVFEDGVRSADRFIYYHFSETSIDMGKANSMLKDALHDFETFVRTYPDSPLVPCSRRKVELLEHLYRAFIREGQ